MYYPVLLDLTGKRCVVVGGGRVGERRALALAEHGARVRVVAPAITDTLRERSMAGEIDWVEAEYDGARIDDAFLVIAATDSVDINARVVQDAGERNILASSTGVAKEGNFVSSASIRRGELLLTVSTSGASPTLASVLREDIERHYGPEWAEMTSIMGTLRDELKARHATEEGRTRAVRAVLASDAVWAAIGRGDLAEAEALARQCL